MKAPGEDNGEHRSGSLRDLLLTIVGKRDEAVENDTSGTVDGSDIATAAEADEEDTAPPSGSALPRCRSLDPFLSLILVLTAKTARTGQRSAELNQQLEHRPNASDPNQHSGPGVLYCRICQTKP